MSTFTFHLLANAHLDPVWLWDWREGLNQGLVTVRTVLDLMDQDEDLTFLRGEAVVYEHIERHDPEAFRRICAYVETGRWDPVGGSYLQSDNNLPATETLLRQFQRGQEYFRSRFGRPARVAWSADAFGHSAGLPEILVASGIEGFAFSRPGEEILHLDQPAFWWEAPSGARVLAYRQRVGWYGTERPEIPGRLDAVLATARTSGLENVGCYFGLGDHGGGPTRRQIADVRGWAKAHPEVKVVFSGLHRLFDALREEVARKGEGIFPVHRGELNYCMRGCYASIARLKFEYRHAEAALLRAERTDAVIAASLNRPGADLREAWDAVLFNSFHDILPGSSMERAFDDQIARQGGAIFAGQSAELSALNALARRVDTRVRPAEGDSPSCQAFLLWNPHPAPYHGTVEIEAMLDDRPLWAYQGKTDSVPVEVIGPDGARLPFQTTALEGNSFASLPWRKRLIIPIDLPACGWKVIEAGLANAEAPAPTVEGGAWSPGPGRIENGRYSVEAEAGGCGIRIARDGVPIFAAPGLHAVTVEDPWGSWGGMGEEPASLDLSTVRDEWTVSHVDVLEAGPIRATIAVRFIAGSSRLDLLCSLQAGRDAVDVSATVFWAERSARLKLVMPGGDRATFETPGAEVPRPPSGEVPGGRWVRVHGETGGFGFASDALYGFDAKDGALRATIVRSTYYANDTPGEMSEQAKTWRPQVDSGSLRFRFVVGPADAPLPEIARALEMPPITLLTAPSNGDLPRSGSLAALLPGTLRLLGLRPVENGWLLSAQQASAGRAEAMLTWQGEELQLGTVEPWEIHHWLVTAAAGKWSADRVDLLGGLRAGEGKG